MMANLEQITSNDETFTRGTYNGINIIKRNQDGFINATKMCLQFDRKFKKIFDNHAWREYYEAAREQYMANTVGPVWDRLMYELKLGVSMVVRGTYVHPKLINYICFWASPRYAVTVGEIMDTINELGHAENQPFDVVREQLIAQMRAEIQALQATITTQETHIAATSVPITNSDKILTILTFGDGYKLSADSTHPPGHFLIRFTFPASMNFKQILKRTLGSYTFPNFEHYDDALQHIRDLSPKTEVLGDQIVPIQPPAADAE
jgi:hypothetical protein